jgi:hypothetical protein
MIREKARVQKYAKARGRHNPRGVKEKKKVYIRGIFKNTKTNKHKEVRFTVKTGILADQATDHRINIQPDTCSVYPVMRQIPPPFQNKMFKL